MAKMKSNFNGKIREKIPYMIFWGVFFLAALLRIYKLGDPSIWVDEAFSIWIAKFDMHTMLKYVSIDAHPPLYFILLHWWIKLAGASEFATRLLSVIFSLGTVVLIYVLCNEIFSDKKYGLLASFFYAVSSFSIIVVDTDVKMYSLLTFLTVLSVYLLCKIINAVAQYPSMVRHPSTMLRTRAHHCAGSGQVIVPLRMGLWAAYVIVLILLLYTHYLAFFVIIAELLYLSLFKKGGIKISLYIIFILLLAFLPWSGNFFEQNFILKKGEHLARPNFYAFAGVFYNFFALVSINLKKWLFFGLFALILALLAAGTARLLKHKNGGIVPAVFFFVIIVSYAISLYSAKKHFFHPRYLSLIFPFFIILLSCAAMSVKNKPAKYLAVLVFIFVNILPWYQYVNYSAYQKQDFRSAVRFVQMRVKQGDAILFQAAYGVFPFNYYYAGGLLDIRYDADKNPRRPVLCFYYTPEYFKKGGVPQYGMDIFREDILKQLKNKYKRVFLVSNSAQYFDRDKKLLKWLDKKCLLLDGEEINSKYGYQSNIAVYLFLSDAPAGAPVKK